MLTVFNRRELAITYSMEEQARILTVLSANGIPYTVQTSGSLGGGGRSGGRSTLGIDLNRTVEYRIYVRRADYDEAVFRLRSAR